MNWTEDDIPGQTGKTVIVTGANTGLGYETARLLAHQGADVILACRSRAKGEAAVEQIVAGQSSSKVTFVELDLSDLESVSAFAKHITDAHEKLDLLINNAGVMVPPETRTQQGFELQFGVNHLGHFALTCQLLGLITRTKGARVVTVSSLAHRGGKINFDDLNFERRSYAPWSAYGQSKLANLLFTLELHNKLSNSSSDAQAVAAHPGWTGTDLQRTAYLARLFSPLIGMKPAQGALPTIRAATDPNAVSGDYYGPHGFQELKGYPVKVKTSLAARNNENAKRLWQVSEALTGVTGEFS